MHRNDDLVELEMVLTNEAERTDDPPNSQMYFTPLFQFGGGESRADLAGIGLVVQEEQRLYLPVLDSADVCLCSDMTQLSRLYPGDSYDLFATFGGLPDDVEAVDLQFPGFPAIEGLAVE